ncbi:MAG TPA: AsnC family protein [Acetobacteraceae bacterium]|jgi:hypothetical protein|nr:AsnC family protein [Acetobacteraceae bacterium]
MPSRKRYWTEGQDTQIRRRRIEGANWETIAAELSLPVQAVAKRADRLGLSRAERTRPLPPDPTREPLPPGHPDSWNVLTSGTVLQGQPYPLRTFNH